MLEEAAGRCAALCSGVLSYLRLLHRPSSGGMFSRSLLDRSRVDR